MKDDAEVSQRVLDLLSSTLGGADLSTATSHTLLQEIGVDSLAAVNLVVQLAIESAVDVEEIIDDLQAPETVADLCRLERCFQDMAAQA